MENKTNNRLLILLGTIMTQFALGSLYTWSLFNQPLSDRFGWEVSQVSITFSIFSLSLAIGTLFSGKLQEKFGIKKVIGIISFTFGLGIILTAKVDSLIMLYLCIGILAGISNGIAYMMTLSNCLKWFPEKKGFISGLCIGAFGTSSVVFKYINAALISSKGISQTFLYWGIIVLVLMFIGALLLKDAQAFTGVQDDNKNLDSRDFNLQEVLRTKQAYLLFVVFFTACMSGLYIIGIVKDIGVQLAHLSPEVAANAVAMVAIFNTSGRLILGTLSDKLGGIKIVKVSLAITLVAVLVLMFAQLSLPVYFTAVAAIGFCFGGNITVFPVIVSDFFGLKNHSKNYGVIYQGFGLGAIFGSMIAQLTGGFKATFMVISLLCIISIVIMATIKKPKVEKKKIKIEENQEEMILAS
ncbi:OFA family MFS transporter [Paraclostridium ghonii]|uniref:L-lactate MFS transporter n=1 Tax=Paraclostridium ghonii TaxID=29358 RepID=UPI00202CC401|nr:OFA family MFS transporter [Paeniclostridium ghonii]MCM0164914.1 OFA family MFS transporter [Paeniclostridium ghonii]